MTRTLEKPLNKPSAFPSAPLTSLDTLWFQVSGTVCNLHCSHCFISCSPTNRDHELMSYESILSYLKKAEKLGVKEYYFTGGEPFLNPEMLAILESTLERGPASVLTNGMLIRPNVAKKLAALYQKTRYSLDMRISIDGFDETSNDAIRGKGSFKAAMQGVKNLQAEGMNPVITVSEACEGAGSKSGRKRFFELLKNYGIPQVRLKILPLLRMGEETRRSRKYEKWESLLGRELHEDEAQLLQCSNSRMITSKGVYVCPLLISFPTAKMGEALEDSLRPFELKHQACFTCWAEGFNCRT